MRYLHGSACAHEYRCNGVAWFAGDTTTLRPFPDVDYFCAVRGFENEALTEELLRNCSDLFLINAEEFEFDRPERSMKNSDIVEYVINQPIVIERFADALGAGLSKSVKRLFNVR
jgi:hypothetical protein